MTDTDALPIYEGAATRLPQKALDCKSCGAKWTIPESVYGARIACRACGAMMAVSIDPASVAPQKLVTKRGSGRRLGRADSTSRDSAFSAKAISKMVRGGGLAVRTSDDASRGQVGMLDDASIDVQSRWLNRSLLEVVAVMAAFWGPHLISLMVTVGEQRLSALPVIAVISGLLIFLIGLTCPAFAFGAIKKVKLRYVCEGLIVVIPFVFFAFAYMLLVEMLMPDFDVSSDLADQVTEIGLLATLFVVAVCPGVFEEIAFRGIVQGRLSALYGLRLGAIYSAFLFATAHTITIAFPIHMLIGLYLVWLRIRCGSLLPGIILHVAYNACIVGLEMLLAR